MKVKECMSNNVISCSPSTTIYDVAKEMQNNHIGCILVCDNENCMVGVITDRDIVLRCIANDKNVKETPVSEIMTTNVCTCMEDDNIESAQNKMSKEQIRRLPVIDNEGKIIGILTLGDLAENDMEIGQNEVCDTINGICESDVNSKNAE